MKSVSRVICFSLLAVIPYGCSGRRSDRHFTEPEPKPADLRFRFEDVTTHAGIRWKRSNGAFGKKWMPETMGGGGAFLDYNNDGLLDILLVNGDWWPGHPLAGARPTLALCRNDGNGRVIDVTDAVGLGISMQGMGVAVGDYDNDGFDDIYVTAVGCNRLFHNERGLRFKDVTKSSGVGGEGWSTSAAWLDYNGDSRLDLYVCHYVRWSPETDRYCGGAVKAYCTPVYYEGEPSRLYRNDGQGRFTDVTRQSGLFNNNSKALGVCGIDLNGDMKTDLIVANDQEPNFVYLNAGDRTFKDVSLESGLALSEEGVARAGMGIDAADINNNGSLAVLIGNFSFQGASLHVQRAGPVFADRSRQSGIFTPTLHCVSFGALFADLNNDGWPDALITNGHVDDLVESRTHAVRYAQPTLLFGNRGDGTFEELSRLAGPGLAPLIVGRGAAAGDFDNDGRLDILLVPNIGRPYLLHNESPRTNHWIRFMLNGVKSNRNAIGTQVRLTAGGKTQTQQVKGGGSYCSYSDRRVHFGLGTAANIDSVEVKWPSGRTDLFKKLVADREYLLTEGHNSVMACAGSQNPKE